MVRRVQLHRLRVLRVGKGCRMGGWLAWAGAPDPSKWSCETGGHGWGNGELQCYTESHLNRCTCSVVFWTKHCVLVTGNRHWRSFPERFSASPSNSGRPGECVGFGWGFAHPGAPETLWGAGLHLCAIGDQGQGGLPLWANRSAGQGATRSWHMGGCLDAAH